MIPQLIVIGLYLFSLGLSLSKDDKGQDFFFSCLGMVIQFSLLYWGGFFNCFFQ
jgi:hypothetical protein